MRRDRLIVVCFGLCFFRHFVTVLWCDSGHLVYARHIVTISLRHWSGRVAPLIERWMKPPDMSSDMEPHCKNN